MQTEPLVIPGLAGPAVVTVNQFTGKHSITVGGQPTTGTRRGQYTLPGVDGAPVPARLRSSMLDPFPSIVIAGVKHRSGPAIPLALRILALCPAILVLGGLVGGLLGGAAILANLSLLRTSLPTAAKAALVAVIGLAAVVAAVIVITSINAAVGRA
jgi:hypothetical protein